MKAKRGEYWYVKLKGGQTVFPVLVADVTKATVLIKDYRDISLYGEGSRYQHKDIAMVEQVTKTVMEKP